MFTIFGKSQEEPKIPDLIPRKVKANQATQKALKERNDYIVELPKLIASHCYTNIDMACSKGNWNLYAILGETTFFFAYDNQPAESLIKHPLSHSLSLEEMKKIIVELGKILTNEDENGFKVQINSNEKLMEGERYHTCLMVSWE
jgi:hypothetical protein